MMKEDLNRFKPSLLSFKVFISVVLIALLVCIYVFPIVNTRTKLNIVTLSTNLDFSNAIFIFGFLVVFLLVYFIIPGRKAKNIVFFIASLIFLGWGGPIYIVLALISTFFTYIFGKSIYEDVNTYREYQARSTMLLGSLLHGLIIVGFGLSNSYVSGIRFIFNASFNLKTLAIPLGIVVYSLHGISYLVDVFNGLNVGKVKYLDVALYMTMFPRLLVGPFESAHKIITQIRNRKERLDLVGEGAICFAKGLAKKLVVANNIYYLFERISSFPHKEISTLSAWIGAFALLFAIYFTLSGYTDMAIGLGKMLGFNFRENFKEPFRVGSVVEMKHRFMTSLFDWLREYVYLPLSMRSMSYASVSIIGAVASAFIFVVLMGSSGRFIVGGIFFSLVVMIEYSTRGPAVDKKKTIAGKIYSKVLIAIGAVIISSSNIINAFYYIKAMLFINGRIVDKAGFYYFRTYIVIFIILILMSTPSIVKNLLSKKGGRR